MFFQIFVWTTSGSLRASSALVDTHFSAQSDSINRGPTVRVRNFKCLCKCTSISCTRANTCHSGERTWIRMRIWASNILRARFESQSFFQTYSFRRMKALGTRRRTCPFRSHALERTHATVANIVKYECAFEHWTHCGHDWHSTRHLKNIHLGEWMHRARVGGLAQP